MQKQTKINMNDNDSPKLEGGGGGAHTASKLWGQVVPTAQKKKRVVIKVTLNVSMNRRGKFCQRLIYCHKQKADKYKRYIHKATTSLFSQWPTGVVGKGRAGAAELERSCAEGDTVLLLY